MSATPSSSETSRLPGWANALIVLALLFIFLVGIRCLGTGFKGLGKELLTSFFQATDNPFVGLVIGIFATTLMQSSSVTTSMIVALVAAPENPLPIANAVPMIMGANIGTTVTNTIVSLGHMAQPTEFKRAFSAATCHDFFNFMTVAILLPLEMATGFLQSASQGLSGVVQFGAGGKLPNPIKAGTKAAAKPIQEAVEALAGDGRPGAVVLILLSGAIIFTALIFIVRTLRKASGGKLQSAVARALDSSAMVAILVGVVVTVMVQSSSITTSVLVPLAGAGVVTLRQVFPVTLGANIGTTLTAILASMAAPEATAHLAVQIAMVHLLFNLVGLLLIYPVPAIREIPLILAEKLSNLAVRSRGTALAYVALLFYGLPALLIFVFQ